MSNEFDNDSIEDVFTRFLTKGKFRKTPERFAILRKAVELHSHFDVDTLHMAIENDGYHVSRATVYNTVELLEEAGILSKNVFGQNTAIYEVNHDNHIHLVCKRCGKIREVENPHIAAHIMQLNTDNFIPESFAITLYGVCGECSANEQS
ncbi:MAG: transcriptional repressor [Muribaculaceae bacterium]|nr:transcriptional repressor [Muribaculaceae bacterium]MDE6632369.1 transcriptional repressor [Muribaculaceae bacterium]